jgi:hypothetical protein
MATFAFSRLSSGTVKVVADTNTYFFGGATKLDPNDTLERIIIFDSFGKKLDIDTSADTVTIEGVTATGTATEIAEDLATDIFFLASLHRDADGNFWKLSLDENTNAVQEMQGYDLFIASDGDDGNDGTNSNTPVQSISTLQTKALAIGNGVRIKFLDEAVYRAMLDLSTLDNGLVDGGYSDLNAADVVAGVWSQHDAVTYPNVWNISWTTDYTVNEGVAMIVDGTMPRWRASIADVNANTNSYHVAAADVSNGSPITVYVNTGGDPNSDGKVYEIMKRRAGIMAKNGFTIRKIISKTQVGNNGSIDVKRDAVVRRSVFAFGHKHNAYLSSGLFEDVISWDADGHSSTQGPFVVNQADPTGLNATFRRCMCLLPVLKTNSTAAFYAHGNVLKYNEITLEQCVTVNNNSVGAPDCNTMVVTNSYFKLTAGAGGSTVSNLLSERNIYTNSLQTFIFGRHIQVHRNIALSTPTTGTQTLITLGALTSWTLEYSTMHGGDRACMTTASSSGGAININHCVFAFLPNFLHFISIDDTMVYTGNYNVFSLNGSSQVKFKKGATNYTTLSAWQAATGQDAQSVYLTTAQRTAFFLGDPATGDFRINPSAQVTGADGTVYTGTFPDGTPITEAGVQEHWNFNTRSVVSGPPTAFPTVPVNYAECVTYIKNPEGWDFY